MKQSSKTTITDTTATLDVTVTADGTGNNRLFVSQDPAVLPVGISTAANQTGGNQKTQIVDASGNVVTTQANGAQRAADVGINVAGVQVDPRARTWTVSSTTDSVVAVPVDGTRATYSASSSGQVPPAAATDIFTITGSATKTIRVTRIETAGTTTAGSGASVNLQLIKRSAANTGGTSSSVTAAPHDSNNAAATATVLAYTANPAVLGASVGTIRAQRFSFLTVGTETQEEDWEFGTRPSQAVVLRGTSQVLAINLGGATITNPVMDITIEWTEE